MTAKRSRTDAREVIAGMGFQPVGESRSGYWRWDADSQNQDNDNEKQVCVPSEWELLENQKSVRHYKFKVDFNLDVLRTRLTEQIKLAYPNCAKVEHFTDSEAGQWCLVEFPPREDQGRLAHGGLMGFRYRVGADHDEVAIVVLDSFAIGQVPNAMVSSAIIWLTESMRGPQHSGGKIWKINHVFEGRISAVKLAAQFITSEVSSLKYLTNLNSSHVHASENRRLSEHRIRMTFAEEAASLDVDDVRSAPTLSLLEARELSPLFPNLEKHVIKGRSWQSPAISADISRAQDHPAGPLYLLRRRSMIDNLDNEDDIESLNKALSLEPDNLCFRSALIRACLNSGMVNEGLIHLSEMLSSMLDQIPALNESIISDLVIPLHIGWCWEQRDWKKAQLAYERILQSIGEHPPVLTRLALLARQQTQDRLERDYLLRLSKVERRRKRLSGVHLRLANLAISVDEDEALALRHARAAVNQNEQSVQAALLCSQLLSRHKRSTEAIDVLSKVDLTDVSISVDERACIEKEMATIWSHELLRADLAEMRLQKFLEETESVQARQCLQDFYRDQRNNSKLLPIMIDNLDYAIETNDVEYARALWVEWQAITVGEFEDVDRAEHLFLKLLRLNVVTLPDLQDAASWISSETIWRDIISWCRKQAETISETVARKDWLEYLARASWEYLSDDLLAADLLVLALSQGDVADDLFLNITDSLSSAKKYAELSHLLELRLHQLSGDAYRETALKLIRLPRAISPKTADVIALRLNQEWPDDESPLQLRFLSYVKGRPEDGFGEFYEQCMQTFQTDVRKAYWVRQIIAMNDEFGQNLPVAWLSRLYDDLSNVVDDAPEIWNEALGQYLQLEAHDQALIMVDRLITQHVVPNAAPETLKVLLKDEPQLMARYLMVSAHDEGEDVRTEYLRLAYDLLSSSNEDVGLTLDVLLLLGATENLTDAQLSHAEQLALVLHDYESLWVIYAGQVRLSTDVSERSDKWGRLAKFYALQQDARAQEVEALWSMHLTDQDDWEIIASWYEAARLQGCEDFSSIKGLMAMVGHSEVYTHRKMFVSIIERLLSAGELDLISEAIDQCFRYYAETDSWEELSEVEKPIRNWGLGGAEASGLGLSMAIFCQNFEAASYWVRNSLLYINDKESFDDYWANMLTAVTLSGMEAALPLIDAELLAGAHHHDPMSVGWYEAIVRVGLNDYQKAESSVEGIRALQVAMEQRSYDERLWLPLYFMLREQRNLQGMLHHLRIVLPQLVQRPDVLRHYPVTFESLRADFAALRQGKYPQYGQASMVVGEGFTGYSVPDPVKRSRGHDAMIEHPDTESHALQEALLLDTDEFENVENTSDRPWRDWLNQAQYPDDLVQSIDEQAFASATEKHVALQVCSVLTGNLQYLKQWPWKVWERPGEFYYPFEANARYPNEDGYNNLGSDIHKFIHGLNSAFIYLYRDRFSLTGLANLLGLSKDIVLSERRPLSWGDISLGGGCFRQFAPAWHKKNFQLFTIEGLNDHVFFEGKGKGIYIDVKYWSGRRVSHLFHKVAFQVQAVQSQFAVMLALDPVAEVLPLVIEVQKYLEQPLTSQLKRWFTGNLRPLDKAFSKINEESCRIRLQKIGRFGESKIQKIWEEMRAHLFTKVLAQTLDVVGLIEFITQQDLLSTERFHPNEITQLSPEVKEVLLVATKLKL